MGRSSGAKASSAVTATCEPFFTHAVWIVRQFPVTEPFPKRANCSLGPKLAPIGPILSPGAAVRHPQKASQGRSGTPGAENSARSSGLQRICCTLLETHASGAVAQNGGLAYNGGAYRDGQSAGADIPASGGSGQGCGLRGVKTLPSTSTPKSDQNFR